MSKFLIADNSQIIDVLLEIMVETENLRFFADQVDEHSYLSGLPSEQVTTGSLGLLLGKLDSLMMQNAPILFEMRDLSEEMIFETIEIFNDCGEEFEKLVDQLTESEDPVFELTQVMGGTFPNESTGYVARFLHDLLQIHRLLTERNDLDALPEKDFTRK